MSSNNLPNEALTEVIMAKEMEDSVSIDNFMSHLTPEQQNRFREIAHHLVYVGFVNGQDRQVPKELTTEKKAAVLISQTEFMLLGAGIIYNLEEDGLLNEW